VDEGAVGGLDAPPPDVPDELEVGRPANEPPPPPDVAPAPDPVPDPDPGAVAPPPEPERDGVVAPPPEPEPELGGVVAPPLDPLVPPPGFAPPPVVAACGEGERLPLLQPTPAVRSTLPMPTMPSQSVMALDL